MPTPSLPLEQQGSLLNSESLQDAIATLFSGVGGAVIPNLALLFQYSGYDEVIQPMVAGGADNAPIMNSFLNPTVGQIVTAGNIRARVKYAGNYTIKSLIDIDPQVSLSFDARGGIVFIPDANLPAVVPGPAGTHTRTGGGGPSALFRIVRRAPDINKQAYEPKFGGFNIDATGVAFVNKVSCFRVPNPNLSINANDPDQNYLTNKKYTGCAFFDMDVVGFSNDQIVIEAGNGRTSYMNFRALNGLANGITDTNNDIVMFGHSAVGGNGSLDANGMGQGHGIQVGKAAGFFCTTINAWDSANIRSTGCSSIFLNQRKMFSLMCGELNGWIRMDGGSLSDPGSGFWRGGNMVGMVLAQFGACYVSDGVMRDTTFPAPDSRLQSNIGIQQYQSLNFVAMTHVRSDNPGPGQSGSTCTANSATDTFTSNGHGLTLNTLVYIYNTAGSQPAPIVFPTGYFIVNPTTNTFQLALTPSGAAIDITTNGSNLQWTTFPTPFNAGGDLGGNFGTAPPYLYDVGQNALVNFVDMVCSAPNVRPWNGLQATFTVTIAAPGVFTFAAAVVPANGHRVVLTTTGALPTGLSVGTIYYVINASGQTCNLSASYGGTAITTTGSQSGTHTVCDFSTSIYNVHNSAQANYIFMDAFYNLIRLGGNGNSVHSHICIGINEPDDFNPNYQIEFGDRTVPAGVPYRNILYGMTEVDNNLNYTDNTINSGTWTNGQVKNMKAGIKVGRFTVAGGGIATGTITIFTDRKASEDIEIFVLGGAVAAITWNVSGTGSISTTWPLPTQSPGPFYVKLFYDHTNNTVYPEILYINGAAWVTLTDGASVATPTVPFNVANFNLTLTASGHTLANPTTPFEGQNFRWKIIQGGAGTNLLSYGANFKFAGGAPTLSTAVGAVDMIDGVFEATSSTWWCRFYKGFA